MATTTEQEPEPDGTAGVDVTRQEAAADKPPLTRVVLGAGGHHVEVETVEGLAAAEAAAFRLWHGTETPHLARGLATGAIGFGSERAGDRPAWGDDDGWPGQGSRRR